MRNALTAATAIVAAAISPATAQAQAPQTEPAAVSGSINLTDENLGDAGGHFGPFPEVSFAAGPVNFTLDLTRSAGGTWMDGAGDYGVELGDLNVKAGDFRLGQHQFGFASPQNFLYGASTAAGGFIMPQWVDEQGAIILNLNDTFGASYTGKNVAGLVGQRVVINTGNGVQTGNMQGFVNAGFSTKVGPCNLGFNATAVSKDVGASANQNAVGAGASVTCTMGGTTVRVDGDVHRVSNVGGVAGVNGDASSARLFVSRNFGPVTAYAATGQFNGVAAVNESPWEVGAGWDVNPSTTLTIGFGSDGSTSAGLQYRF